MMHRQDKWMQQSRFYIKSKFGFRRKHMTSECCYTVVSLMCYLLWIIKHYPIVCIMHKYHDILFETMSDVVKFEMFTVHGIHIV